MATLTPKGSATRRRIVDAASAVVLDRGAAALTLRDVQLGTGVSGSQLTHYFESRSDLLRAAAESVAEQVAAAHEAGLAPVHTIAGLQRWTRQVVRLQQERGSSGPCPVGTLVAEHGRHDPQALPVLGAGLLRWHRALRGTVERLQEAGEVERTADPGRLATQLLSAVQGGLVLSAAWGDTTPLRDALDGAVAALPRPASGRRAGRDGAR